MGVSGGAADTAGISRIEYYVDGVKKGQSSTAPGYDAIIDTSGYAHGSSHELTARSFDVNGRQPALSAKRTFTVDKQVSLTLGATPAAGGYVNGATAPRTVACGVDGAAPAACTTPGTHRLTGLAEGPGCPFKSRAYTATGGTLNLAGAPKGRRLRAGAVLEVRITRPAGELKLTRYTMGRGKAPRVTRS